MNKMSHFVPLIKSFSNGRQAPSVRAVEDVDPAEVVAALNLPPPARLLLISGGAGQMSDEIAARLVNLFAEVGKLVRDHGITIIDGGTDAGVMKLMGQALRQAGATVTHIGVLPAQAQVDNNGTQAEDILDPNHSCFVLVESSTWGPEVDVMYRLADYMSANIPSVALLINGGDISLKEIEKNVEQGREIVVIVGSGRLADEIADTVLHDKPATRERVMEVIRKGKFIFFDLSAPPERLAEILKSRLTKLI
jgi:hypothetical protein